MNIKFLLLALAAFVLQTQAKSFRGDDDFMKAFVKKIQAMRSPSVLKSASASDIAGETTATNPTHQGDINHQSTAENTVLATAKIIEQQLAIGLRTNFVYIKNALKQFADEDGIVRMGVVFCNAKNETDDSSIPYSEMTPEEADYYEFTENLVPGDGFGVHDSVLVDVEGKGNRTKDYVQCGRSDCEEGSFVTLLANRIRSLGYHVTHSDVCDARNTVGYMDVPTCALAPMSGTDETAFQSYQCDKANVPLGQDFYQMKKKCFLAAETCDASGDCDEITENGEKFCVPKKDTMTGSNLNCEVHTADNLDISTYSTDGGATQTPVKNSIRRQIQYGSQAATVKTTDVAYVTGSPASEGGCKSLREFVTAINGAAQVVAFRDTNILEAEAHWEEIIHHVSSYIKSYSAVLKDFYDKSTQIFPLIEFEDIESCPVGTVEHLESELGDETTPLCDTARDTTLDDQRGLDLESQILNRGRCFCRQGTLDNSVDSEFSMYERDEIYLMTESPTDAECNEFGRDDLNFPSYYQYCKSGAYDDKTWKKTLLDLLPMKHAIKTFGDATTKSETQTAIFKKVSATLPDEWDSDNEKVSLSRTPNCGRLITTTSTADDALSSNKGGNCVPFRGLHEILFRLEFETSQNQQGSQNGCDSEDFADEKDCKFEQLVCKASDALENTLFSFNQIGYEWDHPMFKSNTSTYQEEPKQTDLLSVWENGFNDASEIGSSTAGGKQRQNSFSEGRDKLFRRSEDPHEDKQACNINWGLQLTGDVVRKDAAGSEYEDPYVFFERETNEAIVNVDIAEAAKEKSVSQYETLWSQVTAELTTFTADRDVQGVSLSEDIAYEVAEHFMRITTTDSDDPHVDSTDAGAGGEAPSNFATGSR